MKNYLTILIFLCAFSSEAQNSNQPDSNKIESIQPKEKVYRDSFAFCFIKFKIPRICDSEDQSNCCAVTEYPANSFMQENQLGCSNGNAIYWTYFKTEQIAKSNFENKLGMDYYKCRRITCYLNGKKTKGYKLICKLSEGKYFFQILTYGFVNGQSVLVRLVTLNEIKKDKQIQPAFKQILRLRKQPIL